MLDTFHTAINAQSVGRGALVVTPGRDRTRTVMQVVAELNAFTVLFWITWIIVSTVVGYVVLIASDPGFGGTLDWVRSFLWGFGLPVTGQALQTLSLGSINTQFAITQSH